METIERVQADSWGGKQSAAKRPQAYNKSRLEKRPSVQWWRMQVKKILKLQICIYVLLAPATARGSTLAGVADGVLCIW